MSNIWKALFAFSCWFNSSKMQLENRIS